MNKRIKIGIIISVLLVAGFAGFAAFKKGNYKESFVKEINRNLSAENRKIFEDRLVDAQGKLNAAQTDDDKFGWQIQAGFNLQALGRLSEAQTAFENAIKLKPDDSAGYAALFQVQADRGDNEGARQSIKTAIGKNQKNPDLWKKYALLEIEKFHASNETIFSLYAEAINKTDNNIDIITTYADWLEKAGNLQAAKEYWQRAIGTNPASKKVYQAKIDKIDKLLKSQQ